MPEAGKDPHGDPEGHDTDERFEDHPEMAPSQGRMSVERVRDLDEEARKRSLAGDPVEEAGDIRSQSDLDFAPGQEDWTAHPAEPEGPMPDIGEYTGPAQVTGTQAFGRDVGASGLTQEDREGDSFSEGPAQVPPNHKVWAAILKRLGGSSPGSEENLQLADLFSRVQFPADHEGVLSKLAPGAEFRLREGIVVDLHQAIEHSRVRTFRNIGDLVDCVKDELRRMEADGLKVLKMA